MWSLIQIEWMKIVKSKLTKVCFLALVVIMVGMIITEYQDIQTYNENTAYQQEIMSWQEREETVIKYATQSLEEDPWYNALQREQISRRIEIAKYRLEYDIPKDIYKNVWWFFNDNAFNMVSSIVVVMTIVIGSMSVAGEYSARTVRQMLLLPYNRYKILGSKLISMLCIGALLYATMFMMGLVSGFLIHGTNGLSSQVVLYFGDQLTTMNMSVYSLLIILFKLIEIGFYAAFVLFLSVCTKNTAATTVIAAAFALGSEMVGNFLASYYDSINYLPFMNLNFRRYLDFGTTMPSLEAFGGSAVVEGITPLLSASIVIGSIALFITLSFMMFKRQDM